MLICQKSLNHHLSKRAAESHTQDGHQSQLKFVGKPQEDRARCQTESPAPKHNAATPMAGEPIAADTGKDQSYCERGGKEPAQCVIQLQFTAEEWHERAKHGLCKPDVGQHGVCQPSQTVTGEWLY